MIVTPHEIVFGSSDHGCDGKGMWHVWWGGLEASGGGSFSKENTWQI